jgi:hypothetical protein
MVAGTGGLVVIAVVVSDQHVLVGRRADKIPPRGQDRARRDA